MGAIKWWLDGLNKIENSITLHPVIHHNLDLIIGYTSLACAYVAEALAKVV